MDVNELKNFNDFVMALRIIKGFCAYIKNCDLCPFRLKNNWAEYCLFSGPHWGEGVNPEDWELDELIKEEGE